MHSEQEHEQEHEKHCGCSCCMLALLLLLLLLRPGLLLWLSGWALRLLATSQEGGVSSSSLSRSLSASSPAGVGVRALGRAPKMALRGARRCPPSLG